MTPEKRCYELRGKITVLRGSRRATVCAKMTETGEEWNMHGERKQQRLQIMDGTWIPHLSRIALLVRQRAIG